MGWRPLRRSHGSYIAILDPRSGEPLTKITVGRRHIKHIAGAHGGVLYFTYDARRSCGIGKYDAKAGKVSFTESECHLGNVQIGPAGMLVGERISPGGNPAGAHDVDLGLVDPTSGSVTTLSSSRQWEACPLGARRGKRIVFERRSSVEGDPDHPQVAVCHLDR